jgi:hypothetical protein
MLISTAFLSGLALGSGYTTKTAAQKEHEKAHRDETIRIAELPNLLVSKLITIETSD